MLNRKRSPFRRAALTMIGVGLLSNTIEAEDWSQFRGDRVDGVVSSTLPDNWRVDEQATKNVLWKTAVPGEGWSSPIVWKDQVFLTTAIPLPAENQSAQSTKPAEYTGGGGSRRDDLTRTVYRYAVLCLGADSGKVQWQTTVRQQRPPMPRHSSNTYATESPITDGERVYAYFGMTGLFCLNLQGDVLWEKDLGSYPMRAGWGTSSSPVLHEGKLFVQVDNDEQSFVVAIDAKTGEEIWRVSRDEKSQYSSPIIWQNSRRAELIVGGMIYRSYDPKTGALLWQLDMEKGRSSATPIAVGDRLYVGTEQRNRGGADDGGGFLFCVLPGGSGDITPPQQVDSTEFVKWKVDHSNIQMASPAYCDGRLYFLERRSAAVHCLDALTGELVYRKRIRGARAFWASPLTSNGRVYCFDSSGTTFVIDGGADYELLRTNPIDEQLWSSPGASEGKLFLRTADHVYCITENQSQ